MVIQRINKFVNYRMNILKKIFLFKKSYKNNKGLSHDVVDQYIEIMNNLNLANPKMMDIAVPANVKGLTSDQI